MEFSFYELLLVGAIAFMVLGPADFIRFANRAGKWIGKARDQVNNFRIMAEEEVLAADRLEESKKPSKKNSALISSEDDPSEPS